MTKLQSIQAAYDAATLPRSSAISGTSRPSKAKAPRRRRPRQSAQSGQPQHPKGNQPPEEKYLAPPKGGSGGTPRPRERPAVTPADLAKFYDEARRGLWGPIDGREIPQGGSASLERFNRNENLTTGQE